MKTRGFDILVSLENVMNHFNNIINKDDYQEIPGPLNKLHGILKLFREQMKIQSVRRHFTVDKSLPVDKILPESCLNSILKTLKIGKLLSIDDLCDTFLSILLFTCKIELDKSGAIPKGYLKILKELYWALHIFLFPIIRTWFNLFPNDRKRVMDRLKSIENFELDLGVTGELVKELSKAYAGNKAEEEWNLFIHFGMSPDKYKWKDIFGANFFSKALGNGPNAKNFFKAGNETTNSSEIARSLVLLSMLCYRDDKCIIDRIKEANSGSLQLIGLKNLTLYSAHVERHELDLNVYINHEQKWAVFAFRGTEFCKLRDWVSSIDIDYERVIGMGSVRKEYYNQLELLFNGKNLSRKFEASNVDDTSSPFLKTLDAKTLVEILVSSHYKIYFTGHSLGGGFATLFGAMMANKRLVDYYVSEYKPAAIVTFGGTPVGDDNFCKFYENQVPAASWRFVYGDEFAPLVPPFTLFRKSKMVHVGECFRTSTPQYCKFWDDEEIKNGITKMVEEKEIFKVLTDHFPQYHLYSLSANPPAVYIDDSARARKKRKVN